jgi:MFS transporter, PPP family, 3-phenylpropionic acid transporter
LEKTALFPISSYYAFIYMSVGAYTSYISLYYEAMNLNEKEIGILVSLSSVVALLAQPYWGIQADRAKKKNTILIICLLCSGLSIWFIPLAGSNFWILMAATTVFGIFQCAVNPLSDTIALELSANGTFRFPIVRTIGSLGYAVMSAIAGWIFNLSISYIFAVFSALMILSVIHCKWIPTVGGHQKGTTNVRLVELFKNKRLLYIYLFTFTISCTLGFFFSFHAIYSKAQGIGTDVIGLGVMLGSLSQFPFMIFFERIYQTFGILKILLFAGLIHVIRWFLFAVALNKTTILLIWILHGGTYIVLYLCLAEYANRYVAKELRASVQMMNSLIMMGASKIVGGIAGGFFAAKYGFSLSFAVCSAICLLAVIGFFMTVKISSVFNEDPEKVVSF